MAIRFKTFLRIVSARRTGRVEPVPPPAPTARPRFSAFLMSPRPPGRPRAPEPEARPGPCSGHLQPPSRARAVHLPRVGDRLAPVGEEPAAARNAAPQVRAARTSRRSAPRLRTWTRFDCGVIPHGTPGRSASRAPPTGSLRERRSRPPWPPPIPSSSPWRLNCARRHQCGLLTCACSARGRAWAPSAPCAPHHARSPPSHLVIQMDGRPPHHPESARSHYRRRDPVAHIARRAGVASQPRGTWHSVSIVLRRAFRRRALGTDAALAGAGLLAVGRPARHKI
jgi:hypothetical protein